MQAFFDSPETIRNKSKEFKISTFSGFNKQDVMNYLSLLAEQQSIMIGLLREHNIPLYVDDGYQQEEQFSKPIVENEEYISQFMTNNGSQSLGEIQAQLERLTMENEQLKLTLGQDGENMSDFDSSFGFVQNSDANAELEKLREIVEEQRIQIETLQSERTQNNSDIFSTDSENSFDVDASQKEAYEREIEGLKKSLAEANERNFNEFDDNKDIEDIESLKVQLTTLNEEISVLKIENEALRENSLNSNISLDEKIVSELTSLDDMNGSELDNLRNQVQALFEQVNNLKDENEDLRKNLEVQQIAIKATEEKSEVFSNTEEKLSKSEREELEFLRVSNEQLQKNVLKTEREKQKLELTLDELDIQLNEYKNENSKDPVVVMDPETLAAKHKEILEKENNILMEKNNIEAKLEEVNNKLAELKEKEALIESNKELLSEDYVNKVKNKEAEIERLRKQMDKMLLVAQTTADETEKDAQERANKLIAESEKTADTIINEAVSKKTLLEEEANKLLADAEENKTKTEEELNEFRRETRAHAEQIVLDAEQKANEVLEVAATEAENARKEAETEVENIMSEAKERLATLEQTIEDKQSEIEKLHKYFLKNKTECIVDIKKILNKLEAIVYEEEEEQA